MGGSEQGAVTADRAVGGLERSDILKLAFYLFFLIAVLFMMWTGRSLTWKDRVFPLLVGIPTIALLLLQMLFVVRPDVKERLAPSSETKSIQEKFSESIEGATDRGRPAEERRKYEIALVFWITVLPVAMYLLGMVLVLPIYVFAFVWYFDGSLRKALSTTVVFSLLSYLLFIAFLDLTPWQGILFS